MSIKQRFDEEQQRVGTVTDISIDQVKHDGMALMNLINQGFDVHYIFTGVHSGHFDRRISTLSDTLQNLLDVMVTELEEATELERFAKQSARALWLEAKRKR